VEISCLQSLRDVEFLNIFVTLSFMPQGGSLKKELDWIASLRINSSCFEAFALWFCKFAGGSGH